MAYQDLQVAAPSSIPCMQKLPPDTGDFRLIPPQRWDMRMGHSSPRDFSREDQRAFSVDALVTGVSKIHPLIEGSVTPVGQRQLDLLRCILEDMTHGVQKSGACREHKEVITADRPDVCVRHASFEGGMDEDTSLESSTVSSASISDDEEESSTSTSASGSPDIRSGSHEDGPLDTMSSLEEYLPIRRGLSRYFAGKAQSFTSFTEVKSASDLAKAENPYARRRKSAQKHGVGLDRHGSYPPCSAIGGISKRPTSRKKSCWVVPKDTKRYSF